MGRIITVSIKTNQKPKWKSIASGEGASREIWHHLCAPVFYAEVTRQGRGAWSVSICRNNDDTVVERTGPAYKKLSAAKRQAEGMLRRHEPLSEAAIRSLV